MTKMVKAIYLQEAAKIRVDHGLKIESCDNEAGYSYCD
jgi:hypothetical protein